MEIFSWKMPRDWQHQYWNSYPYLKQITGSSKALPFLFQPIQNMLLKLDQFPNFNFQGKNSVKIENVSNYHLVYTNSGTLVKPNPKNHQVFILTFPHLTFPTNQPTPAAWASPTPTITCRSLWGLKVCSYKIGAEVWNSSRGTRTQGEKR